MRTGVWRAAGVPLCFGKGSGEPKKLCAELLVKALEFQILLSLAGKSYVLTTNKQTNKTPSHSERSPCLMRRGEKPFLRD